MNSPLWCCWCDRNRLVVFGTPPFLVCAECYEILDALDRRTYLELSS